MRTHSLSITAADRPPGDVAQGDVGDRGVQHLHEGGNDHSDGDEPGIDRRATDGVGERATLLIREPLRQGAWQTARFISPPGDS